MTGIPHSKPCISGIEARAAAAVVRSGQLAEGPEVDSLEKELGAYCGRRYGCAVSSGTAALYCGLRALGVEKGNGVLMPAYVCTALPNAVRALGAVPVLTDVDVRTGNMTLETARRAMRRNVKAAIVPHMFGFPAPANDIECLLGVPVIEDCAQCVGGSIGRKHTGSLTSMAVFSFYATKVLAAGEGGMVVTADRTAAAAVRDIREYDNRDEYAVRFNFKLSDIHAAIARIQLRKIKTMLSRRRELAEMYTEGLADALGEGAFPPESPGINPMYFRYIIRLDNAEEVIARCRRRGIGASRPVYKPLHHYFGRRNGFSSADALHRTAISLPLYPSLTNAQAARVVAAVRRICGR